MERPCHSRNFLVPVIWSSDIWSFRPFGQFLGGPGRNFFLLSKFFRKYGQYFAEFSDIWSI